uniref:dUTPase-like domain-containing protein n=1 Tax=Tetranychus urticae TaxID=32264 RepID=A0A158P581_TETUR
MSFIYCKCSSSSSIIAQAKHKLGYIIYSTADVKLSPNESAIIKTGIRLKPPQSTFVQCSASPNLLNRSVFVIAPVIKNTFDDEFIIILHNFNNNVVAINAYDELALITLCRAEVSTWTHLPILENFAD